MEIDKLFDEINNENKILSTFVNHKKVDKLIRVRASLQGRQKSEIMRDALKEYFNKYPINKEELNLLKN